VYRHRLFKGDDIRYIESRNRISFYSGSSRMTEESKESLNDIIKYINSLTGDKEIIISGYTDASGK